MKKVLLIGSVIVTLGLLIVGFTVPAFAHGPGNTGNVAQDCWGEPGEGGYHGHGAIHSDTVSELLGLTPEEIQVQRQEGKSLVEIAATQGVTEDALVDAITAAKEEAIQQRVEDGTLTQEQADLMLQQMTQRTAEMVNRTTFGPPEDRGTCGYGEPGQGISPGAMNHWGGHGRMGGGMMGNGWR